MTTSDWLFSVRDLEDAAGYFSANGFVGIKDVFSPAEFTRLRAGVERAEQKGLLVVGKNELHPNNDVIFADIEIEQACKHRDIVRVARTLTGAPIELQHSKYNAKPTSDIGGAIKWHQDYPFYPHTNFDLVSAGIHLDDEDESAGPLRFVSGSHRWGPISHLRDGRFAYECTGRDDLDRLPSRVICCPAGTVTFHHCLTLHGSDPKSRPAPRRLLVFQYRAVDAVQLAGVVWKSTGYRVDDDGTAPRQARFPDGSLIELRGVGGRLYDVAGTLRPDQTS